MSSRNNYEKHSRNNMKRKGASPPPVYPTSDKSSTPGFGWNTSNEHIMKEILKTEQEIEIIRAAMRPYGSFKQYEVEAIQRDQISEFEIFCLEVKVIDLRSQIAPTTRPSSVAAVTTSSKFSTTTPATAPPPPSLAPNSWGIELPKAKQGGTSPPPPPPPAPPTTSSLGVASASNDDALPPITSIPPGKWANELYCWFPGCHRDAATCKLRHCSPEQRTKELREHAQAGRPVQFCGRAMKNGCFSTTCSYYHGSAAEEQKMITQLANSLTPHLLPRRLLCKGYLFSTCPAGKYNPCPRVHPRHVDVLLASFGDKDLATIEHEFTSAPPLCLKRK